MALNLFIKITSFLILLLNLNLKHADYLPEASPVRVTNWGKRTMFVAKDFWNNKESSIIKQIGKVEYEKMLKNFDSESIPSQMTIFANGKLNDRATVYKRLNQLKIYQIATFNHTYKGKNYEDYAILRCPYVENMKWDSSAKWDTIYFIVAVNAVEKIK